MLLITGAFIAAAFLAPDLDAVAYLVYSSGAANISLVVAAMVLGLYLHDLYSEIIVRSQFMLIQQLGFVLGAAFVLEGLVSYVDPNVRMPLHVLAPGGAMAVGGIYCWRMMFSLVLIRAVGAERLLLVGNSPVLEEIVRTASC